MSRQIIEQIGNTDWTRFSIETSEEKHTLCDCCGSVTRRVWGYIEDEAATVAAYFVTWTVGKPDHNASVDLIVGKWGESAGRDDRCGVSLEFSASGNPPGLRVSEEVEPSISNSELVGSVLGRDAIIGSEAATIVFAMADAVFVNDPRIDEVRRWL